ncbi:MAG TPA: hypothetical protein VGJ13_05210 [Pseudonocardiaceae bacterium]|jgi:hypothetical protein
MTTADPEHECAPPDPGDGLTVTFYTCGCGQTWLLHRDGDNPGEWQMVNQD